MNEIVVDLAQRIPLARGVMLAASLYRPCSGRVPAVVILTPYGGDRHHATARDYAAHGLACLAVNARGRGGSGGEFTPFEADGADLADAVRWAAAQSWCDGRVVTCGGSYSGFTQWAMLRSPPAALAALAPTASVNPCLEFPFGWGIPRPYALQWLSYVGGAGSNDKLFSDHAFWAHVEREHYRAGSSFASLARHVRLSGRSFRDWIAHPNLDDYWSTMVPDASALAGVNVPILSVTGQYDVDLPGALSYYRAHLAANAGASHRLVIGPWDHAGTRTAERYVAGMDFGTAASIDIDALQRDWFAHVLVGAPLPTLIDAPFAWYQLGPEAGGAWRHAQSLDAARHPATTLFLSASATGVTAEPGTLRDVSPPPAVQTFVSDPRRRRPDDWVDALDMTRLCDDSETRTIDGDGLVYETAPLARAAEIVGEITLRLGLACSAPDADLLAIVQAIGADGRVTPLFKAARRLRFAASFETPRLCDGTRFDLHIADGGFIGRTIAARTRIRLTVRALNSPYWQKNWQSGAVVADETIADARVATITVFTGDDQGSCLSIPMIDL